ncbi:unnamed protein product [Tilletia controversa]|uniref:Uncharacterized protein n=2 Tax=Tilletia TaxID=13289 RepID=A0A8X7MYM0_9BASI|nr:hypothetical protein CF328_g8618 [Tilletia controversa]KAE8201507.1 hypothetical protein CF336_g172 [Tilletia laevis]KAE8264830.1 hypothetical protein A4X03_0g677 [Tilletia caries]KAE8207622.1 hypothetical protein CF335_g1013 [Tilletia laevis]KAE8253743.1 hypothetical protein A4X06_0g1251 [Tilletia controversa]
MAPCPDLYQAHPLQVPLAPAPGLPPTDEGRGETKLHGHRAGTTSASEGEDASSADEGRRNIKAGKKWKGKSKEKDDAQPRAEERSWTKREKKPRKPRVETRALQLFEEAGGIPETDPGVGEVYNV